MEYPAVSPATLYRYDVLAIARFPDESQHFNGTVYANHETCLERVRASQADRRQLVVAQAFDTSIAAGGLHKLDARHRSNVSALVGRTRELSPKIAESEALYKRC